MEQENEPMSNRIFTIPNLLSLFRLCLVPLMVWLYLVKQDCFMTSVVLILSGISDLVDGYIARTYHMVSDLGKLLDPLADKVTQMAMLYCLTKKFPYMLLMLLFLICKEVIGTVTGLIAIHRTGEVYGADWHGKAATTLIYGTMILHLIWGNIPAALSYILVGLCTVMITISMVMYAMRHIRMICRQTKTTSSDAV